MEFNNLKNFGVESKGLPGGLPGRPPGPEPDARQGSSQRPMKSSRLALKMLGVATILSVCDPRERHQLPSQNCKLLKMNGERGRNRTFNLLIKSTCPTKNQRF